MVYVLVLFVFYTGKPPVEYTVINPSKFLCEAQMEGIQLKVQKEANMLKEQGVEKLQMKCVPMKEA